MGDTRNSQGFLEHNIAERGQAENWVRIGYSEPGVVIQGVQHAEQVSVDMDAEIGRTIIMLDGVPVSFPADMGHALVKALAEKVPEAKAINIDALIATQDERFAEHVEKRQAELDALDLQIADKQAQLDAEATVVATAEAQAAIQEG
jgi:Skp family chaperone for outer membrane proteins